MVYNFLTNYSHVLIGLYYNYASPALSVLETCREYRYGAAIGTVAMVLGVQRERWKNRGKDTGKILSF